MCSEGDGVAIVNEEEAEKRVRWLQVASLLSESITLIV